MAKYVKYNEYEEVVKKVEGVFRKNLDFKSKEFPSEILYEGTIKRFIEGVLNEEVRYKDGSPVR